MCHVPSGILLDAEGTHQFTGRYAVLRIDDQLVGCKPLTEFKRAILEDRSHLHRKLLLAVPALEQAAGRDKADALTLATGAGNAVRPTDRYEEVMDELRVAELLNGFDWSCRGFHLSASFLLGLLYYYSDRAKSGKFANELFRLDSQLLEMQRAAIPCNQSYNTDEQASRCQPLLCLRLPFSEHGRT